MVRRHLIAVPVLCAMVLLNARAAEPPHYTFSPRPPGAIVQSVLFYPQGEGMQSQWRAVASRVYLGGSAYQWYLSIYSIDFDAAVYHLRYRSPGNGGPLSRVTRVRSGPWLPLQTLHIVGTAELEEAGLQDLVVQSHEASADCGDAAVTIFRARPVARVSNSCALAAAVKRYVFPAAVLVRGPYYSNGAPLCCPTRESVTATLRFTRGKWVEMPSLFTLNVP